MRTVIYDAEDMEPITVIDVPGEYLREIQAGKRGPELRFMAMRPISPADFVSDGPIRPDVQIPIVRIRFEPIWNGRSERVLMWLATTMDGETALLLRGVFLPGQRAEVRREREDAFMKGFMTAITGPFA